VAYGDGSYTVGDFATESLTFGDSPPVRGVAVGCGHDNEGLFVGASGLLALGGGPLSFPSQIRASTFSYCLVDRDSPAASTFQFGEGGAGPDAAAQPAHQHLLLRGARRDLGGPDRVERRIFSRHRRIRYASDAAKSSEKMRLVCRIGSDSASPACTRAAPRCGFGGPCGDGALRRRCNVMRGHGRRRRRQRCSAVGWQRCSAVKQGARRDSGLTLL
jgi:hypothetical protein